MASLVREPSGEVVEVPEGENLIGRGPLLKVADKRVSRNHALLRHERGQLELCPKHKNPCFYKARGEKKYKALPKDHWVQLHHDDCFSLLPNDLVFRAVVPSAAKGESSGSAKVAPAEEPVRLSPVVTDRDAPLEEHSSESKEKGAEGECTNAVSFPDRSSSTTGEQSGHETNTKKASEPVAMETTESPLIRTKPEDKAPKTATQSPTAKGAKPVPAGPQRKRSLPPWLTAIAAESKPPPAKKAKIPAKPKDREASSLSKVCVTLITTTPKSSVSVTEREVLEVKSSGADDSRDGSEPKAAPKPDPPSLSPPLPSPPTSKPKTEKKLPLCPYGTKCYRKNPKHFNEYSHNFSSPSPPSDSGEDSEEADRPQCPYGAACYRKSTDHLKEYRHDAPPKAKPAPRSRGSRKSTRTKGKRSVLADDSDNDDLPNTYDYEDSFIDDKDASEASSNAGGDSDDSDWGPDSDSENIADLMAAAKSFIRNKKMRKPV